VGLRAGLDDVEKRKFLTLPGLELRPLRCPARSQSLYGLSCPGSLPHVVKLDYEAFANVDRVFNELLCGNVDRSDT
jgi:hypothetical protein